MKKLVIAGASAVLAAMPVVGVFAAANGGGFTDSIEVTVQGGCSLEVAATAGTYADRSFAGTIAAGTADVLAAATSGSAPAMKVTCNVTDANKTFSIKATASNNGALKITSGDDTIPGGATFSGTTSAWAYSLDGSSWLAVPSTANAAVVSGQTASTSTNYSFNPTYKVYVAPNQKPGTYTGTVAYTVALDD